MVSEEESCSDDEILDDEWHDFFDDEEENVTPKSESPAFAPQPIGEKTIYDLPLPCLQMIFEPLGLRDRIRAAAVCTVFREVVATSKCIGGDQLIVTAKYTRPAVVPARHQLPQGLEPPELSYHLHVPGVVHRRDVNADQGQEIFEKMKPFVQKLHLKELILTLTPLEDPLFNAFNTFIDESCAFDLLILRVDNMLLITERTRALIGRAKLEVLIELEGCDITPELVGSIEKPVRFKGIEWSTRIKLVHSSSLFLDEEFFVELVRKGHSMESLTAPLTHPQTLTEVIEIVSSSAVPQKIDVSFGTAITLQLFKRFIMNIKQVPFHTPPHDHWLDSATHSTYTAVRTYVHGRGMIYLAFRGIDPARARLVVSSKAYKA